MKITRSLTDNKINVICYEPENTCEALLLTGRGHPKKQNYTGWKQKCF